MYSVHAHTNTFAMRFQYVANVAIQQVQSMYCSLVKEHPLTKEHPPPTFGPISCMGSKFTWMIWAPTMERLFTWSLRSTATRTYSRWHSTVQIVVCRQDPPFGRHARYSAHEHSFVRLQYSTCIYVLRSLPTFRAQINKTLLILTHNFGLVSYIRGSTEHMCIPLEMFPLVVVLCWVGSFSNSKPGWSGCWERPPYCCKLPWPRLAWRTALMLPLDLCHSRAAGSESMYKCYTCE